MFRTTTSKALAVVIALSSSSLGEVSSPPSTGFLQPNVVYQPVAASPSSSSSSSPIQVFGIGPGVPSYYTVVRPAWTSAATQSASLTSQTAASPSWTTIFMSWIVSFLVGSIGTLLVKQYFPEHHRSVKRIAQRIGSSTATYGNFFRNPPEDSRLERTPLISHSSHVVSNPVTVHVRKVIPRTPNNPSKSDGEADLAMNKSKRHRTRHAVSSEMHRSHEHELPRGHPAYRSLAVDAARRSRSRKPASHRLGESEQQDDDRPKEKKHHKHSDNNGPSSVARNQLHH